MNSPQKRTCLPLVIGSLILAASLGGCATGGGGGYAYGPGDYPYYYGDVYVGGTWLNGPFRYRDYDGRRQFWVRDGWREGRMRDRNPDGQNDRDRGDRNPGGRNDRDRNPDDHNDRDRNR